MIFNRDHPANDADGNFIIRYLELLPEGKSFGILVYPEFIQVKTQWHQVKFMSWCYPEIFNQLFFLLFTDGNNAIGLPSQVTFNLDKCLRF